MSKGEHYAQGSATQESAVRIALEPLRAHCAAVMAGAGLPAEVAALVADSLVDAEARGVSSHGVARCRIYSKRLRAGMLEPAAVPEVVKDDAGGVLIDAHNAIGHLGAQAGVDAAIERAGKAAVCAVGVRNSNHCGTLGFFTRQAAERGLVAIAMSTAPRTMVYFGGRSRAVGTNPLSLAVPRPDGPPILVDMATSATARGKIILANQLGRDIPEGWAVDADGKPTTNAAAALEGSVTPFAGPKGSGLAMMVELLAGAMVAGVTGAGIGDMYEEWDRTQRVAHLFVLMNPDAWLGREAFLEHVVEFAQGIHDLPTADGFEQVLLPGEVEERARAIAEQEGVLLPASVLADLNALAEESDLHSVLRVPADMTHGSQG